MPESSRPVAGGGRAAAAGMLPLEVRGLAYGVRGSCLIDGIDLRLQAAGLTTILGPNGAGKSLLLRLLHGLLRPTSGRILWNGAPISETVRRRQALVFQKPVLLRRSVQANVEFVLRLRPRGHRPPAMALLQRVGLSDKAQRPARRLSGGEQQRLALARALAVEPEVLLLDEPAASLDPASAAAIEAIVAAIHRTGTKTIFVTHDLGRARRLSDDIVFLHRGRLTEHTPAARFFERPDSREARDYVAGRLVL